MIGLMAITVRLMDDFLDTGMDGLGGQNTAAMSLDRAVLPYSLALFSIAVMMQPKLATALFLAAYSIGMADDLNRELPTGLKSRYEALLAVGLGILGMGLVVMTWACALMTALQCIDDYLDVYLDRCVGRRNICHYLGRVETVLLAACSFILCLILSPFLTLLSLLGAGTVQVLLPHTPTK